MSAADGISLFPSGTVKFLAGKANISRSRKFCFGTSVTAPLLEFSAILRSIIFVWAASSFGETGMGGHTCFRPPVSLR